MTQSDWITLGVAIGTGLLAIAAFVSAWYTGHLHRQAMARDFKSRLLKEIEAWALDARKYFLNMSEVKWSNPTGLGATELQTDLENILLPNLTIERSAKLLDSDLESGVKGAFKLLHIGIDTLKEGLFPIQSEEGKQFFSQTGLNRLGAEFRYILETAFSVKVKYKIRLISHTSTDTLFFSSSPCPCYPLAGQVSYLHV